MKLYLKKSFGINNEIKENPPLSEKGVRDAKMARLFFPDIPFDLCFTDFSAACFGSALILVGNKVIIDKDVRLNKKSTGSVEKEIKSFLSFVEKSYLDKNILIVAEDEIISTIKKLAPSSILIK